MSLNSTDYESEPALYTGELRENNFYDDFQTPELWISESETPGSSISG
jgi:hypothetical protein